jgi:hypothetical protein
MTVSGHDLATAAEKCRACGSPHLLRRATDTDRARGATSRLVWDDPEDGHRYQPRLQGHEGVRMLLQELQGGG